MTNASRTHQPLAERLRPKTLGEVIGQQHLLGEGMALRLAFDAQFITISAVLGGVKDIREAVEQAQTARDGLEQRHTMVFVDEVHRFNKSQQDAFLPHVESGLFTFIGATTENPLSFSTPPAASMRTTAPHGLAIQLLRRLKLHRSKMLGNPKPVPYLPSCGLQGLTT